MTAAAAPEKLIEKIVPAGDFTCSNDALGDSAELLRRLHS